MSFYRSSTSSCTKPCWVSLGHKKTRKPSSPLTTTVPSWWELPVLQRALSPWCNLHKKPTKNFNFHKRATAFCLSSSTPNRTSPDARLMLQVLNRRCSGLLCCSLRLARTERVSISLDLDSPFVMCAFLYFSSCTSNFDTSCRLTIRCFNTVLS